MSGKLSGICWYCFVAAIFALPAAVAAGPEGYSSWADSLARFDLATGTIEFVGTIEPNIFVVGLAFTSDGSLYGIDPYNDRLVLIDPSTAAGTTVGSLGVDVGNSVDLGAGQGGVLWLFDYQSARLYRVDRATGGLTLNCQANPEAAATGLIIRNDQLYVIMRDSGPSPGCGMVPFLGFVGNDLWNPRYPETGPGGLAYVWAGNVWGGADLLKLDLDTGEVMSTAVYIPVGGGFGGSAFPPSELQTPAIPALGVPAIVAMVVLLCLAGVLALRRSI